MLYILHLSCTIGVCVCVSPPPLSGTSVLLPRSVPAASRSHDLPSRGTVARQHPPSLLWSIKRWLRGRRGLRKRERDRSLFIEAVVKKRGNYVLSLKLNSPSPLLSLALSLFLSLPFSVSFFLGSLTCSGRFIHRCSEERGEMRWQGMHEECGSEKKKNTPQLWDIIQSIQMIRFITKYEQLRIVQIHLHTR